MSFLNNLGTWAGNQVKNFGNDIGLPTLLLDVATIATNDKSWMQDAFTIAGDTFKTTVSGASYLPRKIGGAAFNDVLLPAARFTYDVGGKYARQPVSALATGIATGNFQEAWNQRSDISIGQSIAYLQSKIDPTASELHGNFDIFDAKDREIFDTNWRYKTLSGAYDTLFTTITDPLGKVGKAVGLGRKALAIRPMGETDATITSLTKDFLFTPNAVRKATIITPQTLANKINEGRNADGSLYNTMEWFAKNDATKIINHPAVQASNDASTMSWLLGEVDNVDDVADTLLALSNKDTAAMARLVDKRKDLAFVYDKIKPVSKVDNDIVNNIPTNGLTQDVNVLDAAATHLAKLEKDPYFDYLTTLTKKGADLSKRTFGTSAFEKLAIGQAERKYARSMGIKADEVTAYPTFGIFQPTKYHPVVAVINFAEKWAGERPSGYFNANDSDSFKEMQAFGGMLRRLVGNEKAAPIIERHYDDFLKAGDIPENRTRVAQSFEDFATTSIHEALGISKETADYIWNAYKGRRATAMASIKDRKFLMTNDDTILKIPYLERQGANALPMVDLENYARVLKENSGLIKAIDGSHGIIDPDRDRYIAGILNDAWKASVLLRLGYTVRNVSEASLSILAKGYGLVAASDLSKQGFKNWWEHRQIGMDRITDRTLVAKGLREDSIKLRSAMAQTQLERAQIAKLNQEVDDHLAAVELAFKRGQLSEEQAMEFLNLSSYRTGEFLYHGSPTGLRGLNPNRPLAMSYSDDIANRYAEKGIPVISASEIYKRTTGRAYTMPKNLRKAETGELIKQPARKPSLAMQTIASDMRDGFRNSVSKGNQVELYNPQSGTWRAIDPDSVSQKMLVEGTFRVRKPGNQGQVISSKVFGEHLDLRTNNGTKAKLGLNDYPELKALGLDARKPDSWKGKEKEIFDWMRANNIGKITLPDVKANGRATVLVDPTMVETATNKPAQILAKRKLDRIRKYNVNTMEAPATGISELADHIASGKYPTDGITSLIRDLANRDAIAKAKHEHLLTRLDARITEETRLTTSKKLVGTGMRRAKLYDGTYIEYPDAFEGELGQILAQRTDNADTYKLLADAPSQLFAARYGNMNEIRLSTKDPRYFTGYANFLNNFFRSPTENKIDPIIEKFLNGKTPESVIKWLRTPEGKIYASKMNIDDQAFKVASENLNVGTSAEDFVGNLHSAFQRYLPDSEIQEAFRANQLDEMWLREHFADTPTMPDIIGSVVPVGPKINGWQDGTQATVNKLFYFLGSLPETTLARHPLARAVYRSEMQQRANVALSLKRSQLGDAKAELTIDEINGLRKDAVESTRKEVNKTLFTIMRKSYAGEKMRYIMPFFNAWENTVRRWSTLSTENPVAVAKAGQITASLSNQNNVVDKDGNPTDKFSYDNVIVLPMPESFMKGIEKLPIFGDGLAAAIRSAGSQVSVPIRSMDIMFQGEATAGFGPIVAIPAGELEKMRPDLENILKPIIPFGPQEGNLLTATAKSLLPPALQKAAQTWAGTRDGQWSRTFNTVYRYELIKFKLGERNTEPTFEEITSLTNNMYRVKMLSNLILPFAAQYDSPLGWYTQQYRKLQQTYGNKADALFLQMYPEMAEATISASMNNTGVNASQQATANLQKYKSLISQIGTTTPEMIGFLVNDPNGKYDFSQAAYQWQMSNSPVPGSTMNFRGQRDPALLKQDANKKMGWIEYRKAIDYLDSQLQAQGYESYTENGAEELLLAKQMFTTQLAKTNKDWAADFYSMDRGKWIYRMQTIQKILTDPTWLKDNGNRPVVTQIAIYYSTRTQIARELASRKADGGSGSLEANDNSDLKDLWDNTIATLRHESGGEFDGFWQRFLQNDPVTLG